MGSGTLYMVGENADLESFSKLVLEMGYVETVESGRAQFEKEEREIYKVKITDSSPSEKQVAAEIRSVFDSCSNEKGRTITFYESGWVYVIPISIIRQDSSFNPKEHKIK